MRRWLVTLLAVLGLPGSVWAAGPVVEEPTASLRIDCSTLGAQGQGALEARARAEIVLAPRPPGEVAIDCSDHAALVAWRAPDGSLRERRLVLDDDPTVAVDGLLGAVHALRFEGGRQQESAAIVPALGTRAPGPSVAIVAAPRARDPYRWDVVVGTEGELWQGAIRGAVGVHLGGRIVARERWSLGLLGGVGTGWSTAGGLRGHVLSLMLRVAHAPSSHFELGLGTQLKALIATASGADAPAELHALTGGAVASARYRARLGSFELALGPQIEALTRPLIVQVAGQEIFRIPTFVAGFAIYGSRR